MRTRALRPVRQERNRHILGPKLTVIDLYSPLVDTRDRFGKRVGIISEVEKAEKPSVYKAFRTSPTSSDKVLIRMPSNAIILRCEWLVSKE